MINNNSVFIISLFIGCKHTTKKSLKKIFFIQMFVYICSRKPIKLISQCKFNNLIRSMNVAL
jgi:hypothetical protein